MSEWFEESKPYISPIIEKCVENYSLKNLPAGGSLGECLYASTKKKLLRLATENDFYAPKGWKKVDLVDEISDNILESLRDRFLLLGKKSLTLLQYMVEGKFDLENNARLKDEFFVTVFQKAIRLGLVYIVKDKSGLSIIMPYEIKDELEAFIGEMKNIRAENQSLLSLWRKINEVLVSGVNLYGVLPIQMFQDLWNIRYPNSIVGTVDEILAVHKAIEKALPLLIINNNYYFIDGYWIGHTTFDDEEDVSDFVSIRYEMMEGIYYQPTKQELIAYKKQVIDRNTVAYKRLKKLASKYTVDIKSFMSLIESNNLKADDIIELLQVAAEIGLTHFEKEKQVLDFIKLYLEFHESTRVWAYSGFTPKEFMEAEF